jgi:hypothetical protein
MHDQAWANAEMKRNTYELVVLEVCNDLLRKSLSAFLKSLNVAGARLSQPLLDLLHVLLERVRKRSENLLGS